MELGTKFVSHTIVLFAPSILEQVNDVLCSELIGESTGSSGQIAAISVGSCSVNNSLTEP